VIVKVELSLSVLLKLHKVKNKINNTCFASLLLSPKCPHALA